MANSDLTPNPDDPRDSPDSSETSEPTTVATPEGDNEYAPDQPLKPAPEGLQRTPAIGIRNGRSTARSGCGTYLSTASISSSILASHCASPLSAPSAEPRMMGVSSPG